MVNAAVDKA